MGEIVSLLVLSCVGVAYYAETLGYTVSRFERTGGAGVYPRMILACMFVFIVLRILQIIREKRKRGFVLFNLFYGNKGKFFLMFALYVMLMPRLGYIVATTGYLAVSSAFLGYLKEGTLGPPARLALRTAFFFAVTMGIYWFFAMLLDVGVPAGILQYLG